MTFNQYENELKRISQDKDIPFVIKLNLLQETKDYYERQPFFYKRPLISIIFALPVVAFIIGLIIFSN